MIVTRITGDKRGETRVISAIRVDRDPRRRRVDLPISECTVVVADNATPAEILTAVNGVLDGRLT